MKESDYFEDIKYGSPSTVFTAPLCDSPLNIFNISRLFSIGPERPFCYTVKQVYEGCLCAEEWVVGDLARSRRPLVPLPGTFYTILWSLTVSYKLTI